MLKLFSGTANPKLSHEVSRLLKIPLSETTITRFDNSEVKVRIKDDVKSQTCVVIQPISNPTDTHLMEFFFFCDALRRQEAKKVIGIIPYFGYARQDIQHLPGECVSANVIIRIIESIGFAKIYTIDLHDEATAGVFSIPFKNLSSLQLLAKKVKDYIKNPNKQSVTIVSPDQGGIERAREFGDCFFGDTDFSLAVIEKKRILKQAHRSEALDLYGDVKDKIVILVDDIVTSGGTLLNASQLCLDRGAQKVLTAIVHHDFSSSAPQKLQDSAIAKFFTTNTINLRDDQKFAKLEEVSIASLIADELN